MEIKERNNANHDFSDNNVFINASVDEILDYTANHENFKQEIFLGWLRKHANR